MSPRRIRSKQHAQKRRKARLRRLKFYAAGVITVLTLLVGLTHLNAVEITDIAVETEADVPAETVHERAQESLSNRWLSVVSRDNALLLPRQEIRQDVRSISSRIDTVDIRLTGLRSIAINVTNRDPVARACGNNDSEVDRPECYLVDETALLFSLSDMEDDDLLTYYINTPLRAGTQLLPPESFRSIRAFVAALKDIDLVPQRVEIEEGGDLTIPVTENEAATSTASVDLRVSMYKDLEQTAANLQTVIANRSFVAEGANGDEPADTVSPFSLEYIDMRFDNKVFYK